MKKLLLFSIAVILLLAVAQKFDGQEKTQNHRKRPPLSKAVIEQQRGIAQTPFFPRHKLNRWMSDQMLLDQYRMTMPIGQRDFKANTMMANETHGQHEPSAGVDTAWVRHYASGLASSEDKATAIAVDGSGNIYVTGISIGLQARDDYDYQTVKYDTSGSQLWIARYNGPDNSDDRTTALAVDASGNVYVTGESKSSGPHNDYATVKYNSAGIEQWVARYNSPGNGWDTATALTVDASGNVYVTGASDYYNPTNYLGGDYTTIKYNSAGIEQWVNRYSGPGNSDAARALAVDASGNVYVTGSSASSSSWPYNYDYATVKYNSEGGEQWVARYNSPENGWDTATALAVDASGNVYVTGAGDFNALPSYEGGDYTTVKYNSAGVEQWASRYHGPGNSDLASALVVDISGNVYVTGRSANYRLSPKNFDYATVKYNPAGVEQWVAKYNGPGNSEDYANAMAVDVSGNVYVTGVDSIYYEDGWIIKGGDFATVKYNSAGVEQWVIRYNGPGNSYDGATALAINASGTVFVTGSSGGVRGLADFATIKYNSAGAQQWVARYDGSGNSYEEATALVVDASGNVYVTGSSASSSIQPYDYDYATIKYNSEGVVQWVARYNGPENTNDYAKALAVDAFGNVYVTGGSGYSNYSSFNKPDYATVKYNSEGIEQWVARYDSPGNGLDEATALAVDASGNVYVTGTSDYYEILGYRASDYATVKYNSSGVEQWVARYDGPGNGYDRANALAVDASGNVYVTGADSIYYENTYDMKGANFATVKYDPTGIEQWVARYNGPENLDDEAIALALDDSGNVYVTGRSSFYTELYSGWLLGDYATIKYNSAGAEQWVARYDDPETDWDEPAALAVDGSGNVYVTGSSVQGNKRYYEASIYSTIKYNSSGVPQWIARYDGLGNTTNYANALAVDDSGNVYVTGTSRIKGSPDWFMGSAYATIKYNSAGAEQWVARYDDPENDWDEPVALAVDAAGNVYVTGTGMGNESVYTTIKYVQTPPVSVAKEEPGSPSRYWLAQNYPNPFNPSTTIEFALPKSAFVTLKVYNLLGEEVAMLVAEQRSAGIHKLNWDARGLASGVYVYRLESRDFVQTKKLILMH